jgi:hypothetical protein
MEDGFDVVRQSIAAKRLKKFLGQHEIGETQIVEISEVFVSPVHNQNFGVSAAGLRRIRLSFLLSSSNHILEPISEYQNCGISPQEKTLCQENQTQSNRGCSKPSS